MQRYKAVHDVHDQDITSQPALQQMVLVQILLQNRSTLQQPDFYQQLHKWLKMQEMTLVVDVKAVSI